MVSIFRPRRRLACLALALAFSGQALAIGLGASSGQATLGQPLRIRIALVGANEGPLDASCFRLLAPQSPMDTDYVLRDGRLQVENVRGQTHLLVSSQHSWRQPVVEFRIVAGCGGAEVARDYLLLAALPAPPQAVPKGLVEAPKEPAKETSPAVAAPVSAAAGDTLRLAAETNLNALARSRYPNQRETRDEYRRLMAAANAELFAGKVAVGSVPLPAGTVLNVPPNLPRPELAEGRAAAKTAPAEKVPAPVPAAALRTPRAAAEDGAPAARKSADRLVIGGTAVGARPLSPRELAGAIDRLERMLEDQGRIHLGMSDSLKNVELAFGEVRASLAATEARIKALEVERIKAETERTKTLARLAELERSRLGFVEILALVLASGGIGAGLIHYFHRLQGRREGGGQALNLGEFVTPTVPPTPVAAAAIPATGFDSLVTPAAVERPVADTRPEPPPAFAAAPVSAAPAVSVPAAHDFPSPPPSTPTQGVGIDPVSLARETPAKAAAELPPLIEFSLDDTPAIVPPQPAAAAPAVPATPARAAKATAAASPKTASAIAVVPDPTLELAHLMESMGLAQGAAQTLVEHIRGNPAESVQHWLKLLDIYHGSGLQGELADSVKELKGKFNVAIDEWSGPAASRASLIDYPHLARELVGIWGKEGCGAFLVNLIADTRDGTRAGFPRAVVEEIVLLRAVLDTMNAG